MLLPAGTPYEIVAPLGAGGIGEVYKARDTRLNRFVAVKVLPADRMAADEDRFHEFSTGRSRVVSSIPGQLNLGLLVSPDRKTFLFTKVMSAGSDLMLIENFR